jgi:hypothetical protein
VLALAERRKSEILVRRQNLREQESAEGRLIELFWVPTARTTR